MLHKCQKGTVTDLTHFEALLCETEMMERSLIKLSGQEFGIKESKINFSGRNSRSSSIAQEPQSLNSSFTSESPKRLSQHRYSTEADKIFKGTVRLN